ncbi:MAG: hypothetical protein N838_00110 [Thiohalocapsa sp. PB-PSB1]|jgi:sucrose-6F-phosphate phosphohydrolase|nr:MAG: hypothetical protein N838_00110 [Thiohalocapsa sp. PB-PSB1]
MRLLICTDLDRTLLPNGEQPESPQARTWFQRLVGLPEVQLAYVTGRDQGLVREAIQKYQLPIPDFVLADVGVSIYLCNGESWTASSDWEAHIAEDWHGAKREDLTLLLDDLAMLRLQEPEKQKHFKLSYYAPMDLGDEQFLSMLRKRFDDKGIAVSLIWSLDEAENVGLLDILPSRASKRHAIEFLIQNQGFTLDNTVFSGDSGNDLPVLVSPISSILVRNSSTDVQQEALQMAKKLGTEQSLYIAQGGFEGTNGNYASGIMEGVCHYHPEIRSLLDK